MTRRNRTYWDIVSRNQGFLNRRDEQKRVKRYHVAVLGLGLGSVVAKLLVRTGFNCLTIVDGGVVDRTNLNRQPWTQDHVGELKTPILGSRLRCINPHLQLTTHSQMLISENFREVVGDAQIIVNAIGVEELPLVIDIHEQAREMDIPIIEPVNAGWGGGVFVFGPDGPTFEDMIGLKPDDDLSAMTEDPTLMLPYWSRLVHNHLPGYLHESMIHFLQRVAQEGWCALPQLGAGVHITSSIVVTTLVRMALDRPVKMAPEFISFDPWAACTPEGHKE